eukprot:m.26292 g.26292  ORF g.26292 m.26292 type:complete len:283 (-) comp7781_c0_seq2:95-943(-)
MCILFLHWNPEATSGYKLILASNRDEARNRPTREASFWEDQDGNQAASSVLAGRDLEAAEQGTWLGITTNGRLSILTNVAPSPTDNKVYKTTRGTLVSDFLQSDVSPKAYTEKLLANGNTYNGFNVLAITLDKQTEPSCYYVSNKNLDMRAPRQLAPGSYALSNHSLDYPWGKIKRGKELFNGILDDVSVLPTNDLAKKLFGLLSDKVRPSMEEMDSKPNPRFPELSSVFVDFPAKNYGTRTQTVVLVTAEGHVDYVERSLEPGDADNFREKTFAFDLPQKE